MGKNVLQKLRREMVWLLAALLVLGALAGCGGSPSGTTPTGRESQVAAESQAAPAQSATDQQEPDAGQPQETGEEPQAEAEEPEKTAAEESTAKAESPAEEDATAASESTELDEHGTYTSKEEVALYLHTYGHLPDNYITKKDAQDLGWDNKKGNLWDVAPGMSIGGSHFGNYEKKLPEKKGRKYYECDINFDGGYRGAERIIYSNDGLVFYTGDHYENFEQLYPE